MNLDKNDIELEEILYRYLAGELPSSETEEIDAWRAKVPENEEKFFAAKLSYLDLKGLAYYKNTGSADESWEDFKKGHNVRSIGSRSFVSSSFLKYAASILIVASAAFGIYLTQTQPEEISIAANEIQQTTLSDQTQITLNQNATIQYEEPFQNNERRVRLNGDAYFDVTKNAESAFVVEAGTAEVRVLGTRFYINQSSDERLEVNVEEGKVLVSYNEIHEIIAAGQSLSLNLTEVKAVIKEDQTGLTSFWKNRKLIFDLTPIEEVVATVNQAYGSELVLDGDMEGCSLTVTFDNETVQNIVEVISSTLNYEVTETQETYILKGNGCQ